VECFVSAATNGGHYETTSRKALIIIGKHKTSVSLEEAFWARAEGCQPPCAAPEFGQQHIDTERQYGNLSSAIRLFVLDCYQKGPASPNRSFVAADQHQAVPLTDRRPVKRLRSHEA
jgi:predicted DNA-binding ribbon-helix-helix protein